MPLWRTTLCRNFMYHMLFLTVVYRDKVSAIYMTGNPVHHRHTKHINIDI